MNLKVKYIIYVHNLSKKGDLNHDLLSSFVSICRQALHEWFEIGHSLEDAFGVDRDGRGELEGGTANELLAFFRRHLLLQFLIITFHLRLAQRPQFLAQTQQVGVRLLL